MSGLVITHEDEKRLRELAYGIAKDIEDPTVLIERLGFTTEDFEELAQTRVWRGMLDQAMSEWQGATNTPKRVKLKAAVNVEQALPHFYSAMIDSKEPLIARAKIFELMMKAGAVGNPEPAAVGAGSAFNLTIQLDAGGGGGVREITIGGVAVQPEERVYSQSKLLDDAEWEEL